MTHRHAWTKTIRDQLAFWSKRDCVEDAQWFRGTIRSCDCGALKFEPEDGLRSVEVEQVELEDMIKPLP